MFIPRLIARSAPLHRLPTRRNLHHALERGYLFATTSQNPFLTSTETAVHDGSELKSHIPVSSSPNRFKFHTMDLLPQHVATEFGDQQKLWMLAFSDKSLAAMPGVEYRQIPVRYKLMFHEPGPLGTLWFKVVTERQAPVHLVLVDPDEASHDLLSPEGDFMLRQGIVKEVYMATRDDAAEHTNLRGWKIQRGALTEGGRGVGQRVNRWMEDEDFASSALEVTMDDGGPDQIASRLSLKVSRGVLLESPIAKTSSFRNQRAPSARR